ncbi:MAG TPA: ribbon-helix-helix protein, CopG family [Candidatus Baltobacteraceae bacterium]|nr:ribbon-helix-helix protein, CopG family [Candidatus Baltobacteraceae bacterium]
MKYTIEFGPRAAASLDALATRLEVSKADVIRRALEELDQKVFAMDAARERELLSAGR